MQNRREWLVFILAVGALLRFQGLDWDGSNLFHPDEFNLAAGASQLSWPHELVPTFHAYNGLSLYLPRLLSEAISLVTGREGSQVTQIIQASRMLSALWSTLTLVVLANTARRIFDPGMTLFVLISAACAPGLIQSAHFGTTEAGLLLCLAVVIDLSVRHAQGTIALMRYAAWTGVAIAIAFGLKATALLFALLPLVVVASTTLAHRKIVATIQACLLAGVIVVALALATTPQIWTATSDYLATMRFEADVVSGAADVFWTYQFEGAQNGLFELAQLPWLMGPLLAALGLAGLLSTLFSLGRREPKALALSGALCFSIAYGLFIGTTHAKFIRYVLLLLPSLILFAGYLVWCIPRGHLRRTIVALVTVTTVGAGLLQAIIYQIPDSRIAAWNWLLPQLSSTDRVAVEPREAGAQYWSNLPPGGPVLVLELLDPPTPEKQLALASVLAQSQWMVVTSRRHYDVLPRLHSRFPDMCPYYDALWSGRLGYGIVATFQRRPPLPAALLPELWAEETFTVFDSPQVLVLRKNADLTEEQLLEEMARPAPSCQAGGYLRPQQ